MTCPKCGHEFLMTMLPSEVAELESRLREANGHWQKQYEDELERQKAAKQEIPPIKAVDTQALISS